MGLKDLLSRMKREGYIVKDLDSYLESLNATDEDRAINVNAPSQLGTCLRARYYARTGVERDGNAISARTRRIFDNGTHTHIRLQEYMKKQGMLLMDEVPVIDDEYKIQGHTDGILNLGDELAILEIKSINSNGFSKLIDAKPEHKVQGLIYAHCVEKRRKWLKDNHRNKFDMIRSKSRRLKEAGEHYTHLKSGSNYTSKEKLDFQVQLHLQMDDILFSCDEPITKVIFLYENKDTQDLKEFCVDSTREESKEILANTLKDCAFLNRCIAEETVPEREGTSKSCTSCRWCDFKSHCWVV